MKIELTDEQVCNILDQISNKQLYTYLARNKRKGMGVFLALLTEEYNTEPYIKELEILIPKIPIQKELF